MNVHWINWYQMFYDPLSVKNEQQYWVYQIKFYVEIQVVRVSFKKWTYIEKIDKNKQFVEEIIILSKHIKSSPVFILTWEI